MPRDDLPLYLVAAGCFAVLFGGWLLAVFFTRAKTAVKACKHDWHAYYGPGGGSRCWRCGEHAPEVRAYDDPE